MSEQGPLPSRVAMDGSVAEFSALWQSERLSLLGHSNYMLLYVVAFTLKQRPGKGQGPGTLDRNRVMAYPATFGIFLHSTNC